MAILGLAIILAPTIFIALYLWKGEQGKKKRKWLLYIAIVANLLLILSVRGLFINHEEELTIAYDQSAKLEEVLTNYFICVGQVETFDDIIDCNTRLRAGYDYYITD